MLVVQLLFWTAWAMIVYTYVVFPIILALLARSAGRKPKVAEPGKAAYTPRVAMIVAAYNEEKVLKEKLSNTWAIDYPADKFRLVIGSDGSSDRTREILNGCDDSRLTFFDFQERRGKISVLNDLVSRTDAEIIVMSDANTMFSPDAVRLLVAELEDPKVGCVSGELCLEQEGGVSGEGLYWKYEVWIKRNESQLGFLIGCNGGIFALPRKLYEPLPSSVIVEDFVLSMRILEKGYAVRFVPEARGTEPACPSARAEMIRKIRIGAGNFQALGLTRRLLSPRYGLRTFAYWGHKILRWLVPVFFLVALGANIALLQQDLYKVALLLQLCGAVLAGLSYNGSAGQRLPRWTRPISYFYLMNYALLCGLFRFLFGTQRVTWERASR